MRRFANWKFALPVLGLLAIGGSAWYFLFAKGTRYALPEAVDLRPFVRANPPVPIVFTSRSEPASFQAAAPEAEGFTYPGTIPWTAQEGRLRLLDTNGKVYELTWGRVLPDGGTLIDVMSPSVTLDGTRILFAGRKASPDAGRWRIYQVNTDGSDLKPLTGGPDDPGCIALPPLRFALDGTRIPDTERRHLDFDDVDPTDLGPAGIAFASSRVPDLGRDHARRSTQIWVMPIGGTPTLRSANRNNDRWPVLVSQDMIVFSLWSRNREVVTADLSDVRPISTGGAFATRPPDHWMAARVTPNGADFGYAVKCSEPVWRPRPLFNGRIAFMTEGPAGRMRLAQADWGHLRSAPSSLSASAEMPSTGGELSFGPGRDADGRELSAGCPSACPSGAILFAASPVEAPASVFGLYTTSDDWTGTPPVPQLLFDDPAFVDAEPVAAYARALTPEPVVRAEPAATGFTRPAKLKLVGGRDHTGPSGYIENASVLDAMYIDPPDAPDPIRSPIPDPRAPNKSTGYRAPAILPPPDVRSVAFYASHRDRFDDPAQPRITGSWEKLTVAPLNDEGKLYTWVPADPSTPTVVVGLNADGKVAKWTAPTKSANGRAPTFYAIAGDHYSGIRATGYHYCTGCHTGHTFAAADIRERQK